MLRKYLNSIKIVQFAPQVIINISYVKWRDNEHFWVDIISDLRKSVNYLTII
jgi:hypothetical protein